MEAVMTTASPTTIAPVDFDGPYRIIIDGQTIDVPDTFDVVNPASGEVIAAAPNGGVAELNAAVAAAKKAFGPWSALSWDERAAYVTAYADALDAHRDELARLLTLEQGKPLATM